VGERGSAWHEVCGDVRSRAGDLLAPILGVEGSTPCTERAVRPVFLSASDYPACAQPDRLHRVTPNVLYVLEGERRRARSSPSLGHGIGVPTERLVAADRRAHPAGAPSRTQLFRSAFVQDAPAIAQRCAVGAILSSTSIQSAGFLPVELKSGGDAANGFRQMARSARAGFLWLARNRRTRSAHGHRLPGGRRSPSPSARPHPLHHGACAS